jgi:hypothetical protein
MQQSGDVRRLVEVHKKFASYKRNFPDYVQDLLNKETEPRFEKFDFELV